MEEEVDSFKDRSGVSAGRGRRYGHTMHSQSATFVVVVTPSTNHTQLVLAGVGNWQCPAVASYYKTSESI